MENSPRRTLTVLGGALAAVVACVAVAAGAATASRSAIPAVAVRLSANLTAAQEVPAVQAPAARGHWTAVLIRSGPGIVRDASLAGCKVVVPPRRSGLPTRVNCGGTVVTVPAAPGQWRLIWHLATTGLSGPVTGVEIHLAGAGQAAPTFLSLCTACSVSGHMVLGTDQAMSLATGAAYVNVDTAAHPSGEIRGQITRVAFGLVLGR